MMFAFTGLALGAGVAAGWVAAAIVADAAIVAAAAYSAYSTAQMERENAEAQAEIQQLQAKAYGLQAQDLERQASVETQKAALAQLQSEQEAAKRSRLMASDIGSAYANYAGNGLLVNGGTSDTFANVLKTTVGEARQDIETIRQNGRMSVWDYQSNAKSLLVSAETTRMSGVQSLIGAATSEKNAKYYNQASYINAATAGFSSGASAVSAGFSGATYRKKTATA